MRKRPGARRAASAPSRPRRNAATTTPAPPPAPEPASELSPGGDPAPEREEPAAVPTELVERAASAADDREFDQLYREWRATGNATLRELLIDRNRKLVRFLARQFKDRGEPLDDLIQVGNIGLVNAVDRYDPAYGWKFSTFATPTIVGEIKRYFRDKGWSMKVPRRLQELNLEATKEIDRLTQELGRSPTYGEIARSLNATEEEVIEALDMAQAYDLMSLDTEASYRDDDKGDTLADQVGVVDDDLQQWWLRLDLQEAMRRVLDPRERRVVLLAFYQERSQTEIARELGISQMHVSRIQRKALLKLKDFLER